MIKNLLFINKKGSFIVIKEANRRGHSKDSLCNGNKYRYRFNDQKNLLSFNEKGSVIAMKEVNRMGQSESRLYGEDFVTIRCRRKRAV
jgi:hypothetical protein